MGCYIYKINGTCELNWEENKLCWWGKGIKTDRQQIYFLAHLALAANYSSETSNWQNFMYKN